MHSVAGGASATAMASVSAVAPGGGAVADASASASEHAALATHLRSHLLSRGGMMLSRGGVLGSAGVPPVALLPRPLPAAAVAAARALAQPVNALVDALARGAGAEWMLRTLEAGAARGDDFTGRLCALAREQQPGAGAGAGDAWVQPLALGLHRADYMIEAAAADDAPAMAAAPASLELPAALAAGRAGGWRLRQIEVNTVSAGFAVMASRVSAAHRYLLTRFTTVEPGAGTAAARLRPLARALAPYCEAAAAAAADGAAGTGDDAAHPLLRHLPANTADVEFASAIAAAHAAYGVAQAIVLFVVQPNERNLLDQLGLESALWERHGVRVRRATLGWLAAHAQLGAGAYAGGGAAGAARTLRLPCEFGGGGAADEVSVVYFRAGYAPGDYVEGGAWAARALLERSAAVKCPPILYHLAGTKKVQQALAGAGVLERFLPADAAAAMRESFAGLWSLDAAERDGAAAAAILDAARRPARYVVKPQREGGGNNLFGAQVADALAGVAAALAPAELPLARGEAAVALAAAAAALGAPPRAAAMADDELAAHILMQRVFPAAADAVLCPAGDAAPRTAPAVCELGVFSAFLGDGRTVLLNSCSGLLLRTKLDTTDEGGVAAGFAYLDSPFCV